MTARWPALPKTLRGAGGPIKVRQIKRVRSDDDEACWGTWSAGERTIRLEKSAPLAHRWRVLYHEWAHSVLDDAGISNLLSYEGNEALCDAIATARVQEMRGALGLDA